MAQPFTVEWDSRELNVLRGGKVEAAIASTLSKAGNEAARKMKAESNRQVRDRKRFKVAAVNKALPLIFPGSSKEIHKLVWRMKVAGTPVPLAAFPHRQQKNGVMVEVNTGKRKLIKSAFTAQMKSGHEGIFRRKGDERLPIQELWTTKISDVFKDGDFIPHIQGHTQQAFTSAFARLLPLELNKIKA
jgi:hypothetical protein